MASSQSPVHLIINPSAASGKGLKLLHNIESKLQQRAIHFQKHITAYPKHATEIVRSFSADEEIVIAVGGDGTVNEVINGMVDSRHCFGIIPAGTGDDFARILGMKNIDAAVDAIDKKRSKRIDIGLINFTDDSGETHSHYFANTMGIGFNAVVAAQVIHSRFGKGIIPYLFAVFKTLRSYSAVPARIFINGRTMNDALFLATIGNGTTSGGGFILSPRAQLVEDPSG